MTLPKKLQPKSFIKKIYKRLRREFLFLFPIAVKFFFDGQKEIYVEIRFGGEGIFRWFFLSNKEYFKKYKNIEGVLGDVELLKKISKIQILARLHGKISSYTFSSFEELETWLYSPYGKERRLIFKVSERTLAKLEKVCREEQIRKSDLLRSLVTYWLWGEGK